jgi:cytochrome c
MHKPICFIGAAAVAGLALLAPALAADPNRAPFLAEKRGCMECHAIGSTNGGPSFPAIAVRYRYQEGAREMLVDKIRIGGVKHWGERFNMWPQYTVPDDEAHELVDWILQQ